MEIVILQQRRLSSASFVGVADAVHISFAEATADSFISCDDKLLNKCIKTTINLEVMNPVKFAVKEDLK